MRITPDGSRYLAMARGEAQPLPFHVRPLLPWMLGDNALAWIACTWISIGACAALTYARARQVAATEEQAAVAALLWLGLPSVRFWAHAPVLVDAPCVAFSLLAAVLWRVDPIASGVVLAIGACVSEKVPVFAALFAWEPLLLAGLLVPLTLYLVRTPGKIDPKDPLASTLRHPIATGISAHAGKWRDPMAMALPWGAALAALALPQPWWMLTLAVATAQLLVATDTVRLMQLAAPVVCIGAAAVIPVDWAVPILVAHWLNPFAGSGT